MRLRTNISVILFVLSLGVHTASAIPSLENLTIYMGQNPPYNYSEGSQNKGASVEVLVEIFKRLNVTKNRDDLVASPWARAYNATLQRDNTMLFSVVRSPDRENKFKWVGPINIARTVLLAKQDSVINFNPETAFKTYRYGVEKNSRGALALQTAGTPQDNLIFINSSVSAAHMLLRGRFDMWSRDMLVAFWIIEKQGLQATDFKVVHSFEGYPHYFAFNRETDDALIDSMQQTLDAMREDGTLARINTKHLSLPCP